VPSIIHTYQQRITQKPHVPSTRFEHTMLGANGVPNNFFIAFLFSDHDVGVRVLKVMGLIPSSMVCCKCGSQTFWCFDTIDKNGYRRRCQRARSAFVCRASTSITHGAWFQQSRFCSSRTTSFAAFLLTLSCKTISLLLQTSLIGLWNCVLGSSQKIGGPNKPVEIEGASSTGAKYNRGHRVKGQWVFHGVERESAKTFLFPIPDRNADRLMAVLRNWIEPGTTVISD